MTVREGNLEAPTRHPLDWRNPDFYDQASLDTELERVFDICHGCRRCVSLCSAFPTLFDLIDETKTRRGGRRRQVRFRQGGRPVLPVRRLLHDEVPVRAAASVERRFPAPDAARQGGEVSRRRRQVPRQAADRAPTRLGKLAVDSGGRADGERRQRDARRCARSWKRCSASPRRRTLPPYASRRVSRARGADRRPGRCATAQRTPGKVAIFATCYVNYNEPGIGHDLVKLLAHNEIPYRAASRRKRAAACPSSSWAISMRWRSSRT